MRLLLDTHVLLWWLADDPALTADHRDLIGDERNTVLVSAVSVAEVAIKSSIGKLDVPADLTSVIGSSGFDDLPFTVAHAEGLRSLPWHHRDPFDRMLICQARVEAIPFLSADARCREYEVEIR